ncbi:MAG: polysaccharide deacetylase family protein, partial [Verrucomicrobiae bacterium]|nr:polysaccharide deacetylase family protein [Verrucomicrobiae bacterium]
MSPQATSGLPPGRSYAVLTMDVEDWYHLDYFARDRCDPAHSLLDGLETYRGILTAQGLESSFFVLGELADRLATVLRELAEAGHDVGSHGWDHRRPLTMSPAQLGEDLRRSKRELEDTIQRPVLGYRAPCFSLDRARLEEVRAAGHTYDSSRIDFGAHPLYGTLDMQGFEPVQDGVFRQGAFVEFEVSTLKL